jgi:phosphoglycolate phosphatase
VTDGRGLAAVIFDCDGVLFDSWRANVAYYNAIRQALGLAPMDAAWEGRAHVLAASQLLDAMFAHDPAALERARGIARALDYEPFYGLMEPAPGLHALLARLRRSYRLAMASNRGRTVGEVARRFGLAPYLDAVVGVLDVARPKPHPDMLEACLARLDVPAASAVYVGDSAGDRAAAEAAGVHFVGIGPASGAGCCIARLDELPGVLQGLPSVG